MALTRKYLEAMGLSAEQVEGIIAEHVDATNGLKGKIEKAEADAAKYKAEADKVPDLEKKLKAAGEKDDYKEKYESTQKDFDAYKATVEADKSKSEKKALYRDLLTKAGVNAKRLDAVMRVADIDALEVKDGALVDADKLTEGIKTEWADFITTTGSKGADVDDPVDHNGGEGRPTSLAASLREKYSNE